MKRIGTCVLMSLCLAGGWSAAQTGGDLQARILYSYYAEDANGLSGLVQLLNTLERSNGADNALRYHLAHAYYRLGLLAAGQTGSGADRAFDACIDALKEVLDQDGNSVEALTLQSACYSNLARLRRLGAVLQRSRAEDRIKRAAALAPRNPRVQFVQAADELSQAKDGSPQQTRALRELQLAAQEFEQSSATAIDAPGWGHAEAYLELGRQLEARGNFLDARNWIEKSLIVAPDFKAAQRQLATLQHR
jgi:tetratricopeptide (TPR) repeat protein